MSIEFRSVTKRFPDGTVAVDDFSMTIPAHEITVFVGPSGCGKTTLLRMINRVIEPSSGAVLIDGEDIAGRPAVTLRRSIGYVMQNSGLLPHRRVIDNIATVPRLMGVAKAVAREHALTLMEVVSLRLVSRSNLSENRFTAFGSTEALERGMVERFVGGDVNAENLFHELNVKGIWFGLQWPETPAFAGVTLFFLRMLLHTRKKPLRKQGSQVVAKRWWP